MTAHQREQELRDRERPLTTIHFAYPSMPPHGRLAPADLARRFEDAHHNFMMSQLGFGFMAQPGALRQALVSSMPPTPNEFGFRVMRLDGTSYLDTSVERITAAAEVNLRWTLGGDALRLPPMYLSIWLDNETNRTDLIPKRHLISEFEFLRHLRNAAGHGNRFHFEGAQPKRPAQFKGFKITRDLEGSEAFYSFMGPGDYLEFLDTLADMIKKMG